MKYYIEPLNEGQSMNCRAIAVTGSKRNAIKQAATLAAGLQRLLPGNSITCRVGRYEVEIVPDAESIVVTPDGVALDTESGRVVSA